jgi:hypothetical protein
LGINIKYNRAWTNIRCAYLGGGEASPDDEGDNGDEDDGNDKAGVVNSKNLRKPKRGKVQVSGSYNNIRFENILGMYHSHGLLDST